MNINHEIVQYKNYGRCLKIRNHDTYMYVTLDFGPRIIYYGKDENILYEDVDDNINKSVSSFCEAFEANDVWHIYGGHRLWKAPEDDLTYYPDNNPVEYEIAGSKAIIKAPIEKSTSLEKHIIIESLDNGNFSVTNRIINRGNKEIKVVAWGLSVCKPSGKVYIDYTNTEGKYLPNRMISLWPYTDILDERIVIDNSTIVIDIRKEKEASKEPLKIGCFIRDGKITYKMDNGQTFIKKLTVSDGIYPDYGCNLEVYTINFMVELETLSPFKVLKNDEYVENNEIWSLI